MRILFISNLYPPYEIGGMEQLCQEIVNALRARGHTCHVLTSRHGVRGRTPGEPEVTRVLHPEADMHHYRPLDFYVRRPWQERANRQALRATLDAFEPGVLFIWGMWNLSGDVAHWAEQWMRAQIAYYVASYWPMDADAHQAYWQQQARRPWVRALMAPARSRALRLLAWERASHPLALKHVACVSEYVLCRLTEAGALPNGGRVIYNGIDPRPFLEAAAARTPRSDGLHLVYTGGVVAHKGVHTAVEALGLLRQSGEADGIHLTLVGGGHPDYVAQLRRRVEELTLAQHVTFRGRVPRNEIPAILAEHEVFLFPSIWEEPIARTVMEAMAAGLAVVGTSVGGQAEMLKEGVNALIFPADDAAYLAGCILRLRSDPGACARLAAAGRRMVLERFTLERMADEMEGWLSTLGS
jgi:glycogen(starch) synthase